MKQRLRELEDAIKIIKREARLAPNLPLKLKLEREKRNIETNRNKAWAVSFGFQGHVEDAVLADFPEELYDTPMWRLVEEAAESGHLLPEEIHSEFSAFFRDELSQASWNELRAVERVFLQAAALGNASILWILGLGLVRAPVAVVDSGERENLEEDGLFLLVEAAEAGDARAQWLLGERFSRMQDGLDESVRLLGMAASQGLEQAAARLEELFEHRYTFVHAPSIFDACRYQPESLRLLPVGAAVTGWATFLRRDSRALSTAHCNNRVSSTCAYSLNWPRSGRGKFYRISDPCLNRSA